MRVALVFKRFAHGGGTERQVAMLSRHLAERGDDVHVYCASVRDAPPAGVTLHRMPRLPLGHTLQLLAFSRWARKAISVHERQHGRFDIRHAFGRTVGQDVYRLGGGCHRTYLETAHALERPPRWRDALAATPYQRLKARMEEQAIRAPSTRAVLVNSEMVRDDLRRRYGVPESRLYVVRNGVDLDLFRPGTVPERTDLRRGLALPADAQVALFLGTGFARKGLEAVLRAWKPVSSHRETAHLLVAGRDPSPARWHTLAHELGLAARVHFLGPRSDPESLYRCADVYVLPTAYDASANTTLEALASGLPVITSAMDGAAEIVESGVTGSVLRTPVHPDHVAEALEHWLSVEGGAPRARASAEAHSIKLAARTTRAVYEKLVSAAHT